jgi:hypothetical protein
MAGFLLTLHVGIAAGFVISRWLAAPPPADACSDLCRILSDRFDTPRLEWQQ